MSRLLWIARFAGITILLALMLFPRVDIQPRNRDEGTLPVLFLVLAGIGLAIGGATRLGQSSRNDLLASKKLPNDIAAKRGE